MKNDLEKKKESLLQKLFGLKDRVEREKQEREAVVEIETLQAAIEATNDEIFAAQVEGAKVKVKECEAEAQKLAREKKDLQDRTEEIDRQFLGLFISCEGMIPKKKIQISSQRMVKMEKEVEWSHFVGLHETATAILENGVEIGRKIKTEPKIERKTKKIEVEIVATPVQLEHAESLGFRLKEGQIIEPEPLTDENSVLVPVFPMPQVFSGGI